MPSVRRVAVLVLLAFIPLAAASPAGAQSTNVEIVVEHDLYDGGEIAAGLSQYLADITFQGYTPILTTSFTATSTAEDLRAHLAARYTTDGLAGAVLIGHLPVGTVYTEGSGAISGEFHPCDLYYMDLDGSWTSSGLHGYLPDTHTDGAGDVGPEVWLGRLTTWNLTLLQPNRTEASLLNDYFAKNHAYRTGVLTTPRTGLAYTDDDWNHVTRADALALAVEAVTDVWNDPDIAGDQTTAANYKWRLANESYEHILLSVHSSATSHSFRTGASSAGSVLNSDLLALDPQALFYNLFACSAAKYTDFGYIAGEYVFGEGTGLLAVGTTKTGGMLAMADYFGPLGLGATFGDAMLDWWHTAVDPSGHSDIDQAWFYGMTTIGDPLLLTQAFIPEPATLGLLVVGAIGLLRRRRRPRP